MKFSALILCLALATGCIHKATPVTPWERVTTDNAVFSQIDNTVEQGAEAVSASGLLPPAEVVPVIAWTGQVATAHQQITAILAKGSTVDASDYATIRNLLDQIKASGADLVNSGALGVKNPKSQQTIAADIQALINLASAILTDVSLLQGTTAPALKGATN